MPPRKKLAMKETVNDPPTLGILLGFMFGMAFYKGQQIPSGSHRWELMNKEGEGTFSMVFTVRDVLHPKEPFRAMKITKTEERDTDIHKELRTLRGFDSAGIVQWFDSCSYGQLQCTVMEMLAVNISEFCRLKAGELDARTEPRFLMPLPKIVQICRQIGEALRFLHSNGYIHADVKAENVLFVKHPSSGFMVMERYQATVPISTFDFDSVKLVDLGTMIRADQIITSWNSSVMTINSRPPENALRLRWNKPIDMWGLGSVMFELLFNQHPPPDRYRRLLVVSDEVKRDGLLRAMQETIGNFPEALLQEFRSGTERNIQLVKRLSGEEKWSGRQAKGKPAYLQELEARMPKNDETQQFFALLRTLLTVDPNARTTAQAFVVDCQNFLNQFQT